MQTADNPRLSEKQIDSNFNAHEKKQNRSMTERAGKASAPSEQLIELHFISKSKATLLVRNVKGPRDHLL